MLYKVSMINFHSFSISQLLQFEYSTVPFIISSMQFSSSLHEKQLRNRETVELALLRWLTSQPYYPISRLASRLAGYGSQPDVKFDLFICLKCGEEKLSRNFFLLWFSFFFFFVPEQHEDLVKQIKKSVIYTLALPRKPLGLIFHGCDDTRSPWLGALESILFWVYLFLEWASRDLGRPRFKYPIREEEWQLNCHTSCLLLREVLTRRMNTDRVMGSWWHQMFVFPYSPPLC